MNRVNVVIVKIVVFLGLLGGMLLGGTTRANAATAGCTATGNGGCEYDTLTPCENNNIPSLSGCTELADNYDSGSFVECINCDTNPQCHTITGNWTHADCTVTCFGNPPGQTKFSVSKIVWTNIGAKCP